MSTNGAVLTKIQNHKTWKWVTPEDKEVIIQALSQPVIDKSRMMYEIYMEGVNMAGEYQGCWVRFKNIEKIIDRYISDNVNRVSSQI